MATHQLARQLIVAKIAKRVQAKNACNLKRKHLCNDIGDQRKTTIIVASFLSKIEVDIVFCHHI